MGSTISNANNGILARGNVNLNLDNSIFENNNQGLQLEINPVVHSFNGNTFINNTVGVGADSGQNRFDLISSTNPKSPNVFTNNDIGIYANDSRIYCRDNSFNNNGIGIQAEHALAQTIFDNNFVYNGIGIDLLNTFASSIQENYFSSYSSGRRNLAINVITSPGTYIRHNDIYTSANAIRVDQSNFSIVRHNDIAINSNIPSSIFLNGIPVEVRLSEGCEVHYNQIQMSESLSGITVNGGASNEVYDNSIDGWANITGRGSAINIIGGATDISVFENLVTCNGLLNGITNANSVGNTYECNSISGQANGLDIGVNSMTQNILTNILDANIDLIARSRLTTQYQNGNLFEGGSARYFGSDLDMLNSLFYVQDNANVFPNHRPIDPVPTGTLWFLNDLGLPDICDESTIGGLFNVTPGETGICNYLLSIESMQTTNPERYFVKMFHLLQLYKFDDQEMPLCLEQHFASISTCGLLALFDSYIDIIELSGLNLNSDEMEDLHSLYGQMEFENNDQSSLLLEIQLIIDAMSFDGDAQEALFELRISEINQDLENVSCTESIVSLWASSLQHYLKLISGEQFTDTQEEEIIFNSQYCVEDYGDAVHWSRSMARAFSDLDFEEFDDCSLVIEGREEESQDLNDFMLVPNPNTGIFKILFDKNIEIGLIQIYGLNGQLIFDQTIAKDQNSITINEVLPGGVYVVKHISNSGASSSRKMFVN